MAATERVEHLVLGAGITGLAFANFLRREAEARDRPAPEVLVLEREEEPGGYCRTVVQDGFVWDYSGHFFHFKRPAIERYLTERMDEGEEIRSIAKRTFIRYAGLDVDFPFQKNIHQLPREDFLDCLYELYFREEAAPADDGSFKAMLYRKLGRGIADRFLIPYNEKLYATDLGDLDTDAMGRFFPHADVADIIRNIKRPDNASYNATFTYPKGGAIQYVRALLKDLPPGTVALGEPVLSIDLAAKTVTTAKRTIAFRHLVSSAPLPRLLGLTGLEHDADAFTWNKVLVFNLGFDRKGPAGVHWMYFPDRGVRFYRVGFYDNIHEADRMSLYVEIGARADEELDVEAERARVLKDLEAAGLIDGHRLVSWHSVVLDPAYVHITKRSLAETARTRGVLESAGVYSAGRYGAWTYCSIEDNIVEAEALAVRLGALL